MSDDEMQYAPALVGPRTGMDASAMHDQIRRAMVLVHASLAEAMPWMPVDADRIREYDSDMAAMIRKMRQHPPTDAAIERLANRVSWLNYVVRAFAEDWGDLPLDLYDEVLSIRMAVEALGVLRMSQASHQLMAIHERLNEIRDQGGSDAELDAEMRQWLQPIETHQSPFVHWAVETIREELGVEIAGSDGRTTER